MKRIAIFCDGTWNSSDARYPTNVVKLSLAAHRSYEDAFQEIIYVAGVGSGRGTTDWSKTIDRWGGGLFGWGLTENLEDAYRQLAFGYELGDELFVFGFSRGAFTARSLCGLIRSCGIPSRGNVPRLPEAIERYRTRGAENTHPDHPDSFAFRREFAPWVHTSPKEREWRVQNGVAEGHRLTITYLGVWDTVGALGVPKMLPFAPHFNRKYQFHDTELSSSVLSARHAVAIDERRVTYPPTLWSNLDELNARQPDRDRPYRQEWFPGDHGSVGGGGDVLGLSSHSLLWILEGAAEAGFRVDEAEIEKVRREANATASLSSKSFRQASALSLLNRWAADRDGPEGLHDVSVCARERWQARLDPAYRPATLGKVAGDLDAIASSRSDAAQRTG
jgi:uncharacterized protein (DUF2235 family)